MPVLRGKLEADRTERLHIDEEPAFDIVDRDQLDFVYHLPTLAHVRCSEVQTEIYEVDGIKLSMMHSV